MTTEPLQTLRDEQARTNESLAGITTTLIGLTLRVDECHASVKALRQSISALHADVRMIVPNNY